MERFWSKVGDPTPAPYPWLEHGCREWTAGVNGNGYGWFYYEGRPVIAPRMAFYLTNGYWPEETRHACDNPLCCEPTHLLDGSKFDNQRDSVERGRNRETKKSRCPRGHPYDVTTKRGWRRCRTCDNELRNARRAKRREETR